MSKKKFRKFNRDEMFLSKEQINELKVSYAIISEVINQELRQKSLLNTIDQMVEFAKILNELKNIKPMEITEDTRIKELIPEGYELETKILKDVNLGIFGEYINIPVKKKEVKDFEWYAQRYFDKIKKRLRIELIINSDFADVDFPFEFKIGLLKFICDDLGVNVEAFIIAKSFGGGGSYAKVEGICPPEFLNSIFK